MTKTQNRLYTFLLRTAGENVQPSIAEMALHLAGECSTSPPSIHRMLLALEKEGLVERLPLLQRCWRAIVKNPLAAVSLQDLEAELRRRGYQIDPIIESEQKL